MGVLRPRGLRVQCNVIAIAIKRRLDVKIFSVYYRNLSTIECQLKSLDVVNGLHNYLQLGELPGLLEVPWQHLPQLLHVVLADVVGVQPVQVHHVADHHHVHPVDLSGDVV